MENNMSVKPTSFSTQTNALMRKNITFQRRNMRTNIGLLAIPFLLCMILFGLQKLVDSLSLLGDTGCNTGQGSSNSTNLFGKSSYCADPHPSKLPVLAQIPSPQFRATRPHSLLSAFRNNSELPQNTCKSTDSCPVTILFTGQNQSLARSLGRNLFGSKSLEDNNSDYVEDPLALLSEFMVGTSEPPPTDYYFEPALTILSFPLYVIQPKCPSNFTAFKIEIRMAGLPLEQEVACVNGRALWRDNSSVINSELFMGYHQGNPEKRVNEYVAAYDYSNTNANLFDVTVWYNATFRKDSQSPLLRILRATNAASNSFLKFFKGPSVKILLEFVKEVPKEETKPVNANISTLFSPLFFTWVIELLIPVMLSYIVYEKQKNMRMMMKMHGLGDRPYWIITYAYFVILSICYILTFTTFGSLIGLKIFTLNEISVQLVFFFVYINLQIVFTIFLSVLFSDVKTATVIGYIYVIGSGILGPSFLEPYIEDEYYPRVLLEAMEIFPGFSLYHGLYELSRYSLQVEQFGTPRVCLKDIITEGLAMRSILIIMIIEWVVLGFLAYYLDQIITNGKVGRHPLRFFPWSQGNQNGYKKNRGYDVLINMEKPDVAQEREIVQKMMQEQYKNQAVICDDMKKVYPGSDGNPDKHAVRGLSLTISQKECFGLLGPNGAGKTSFIKMMTGLTYPTSGTAFIQGLDICKDMKKVHTFMGICPQHDLTWDILTGKEHLLFYGRLKNLKGDVLKKAVVDSLQAVNLLEKADVQVGEYSGGMKRRISVAISLIGNPKIVYMDEPSTGLDPASRKRLWSAVQSAKKDRAILLTTHSMEEADALCDRIGIFVDGYLQCIGSPSELKARYGGYLVLTVTTPSEQEEEVERLVQQISSKAIKVYHISGTQKFQLPKQGLKIGDIFRQVQSARTRLNIQAWGLSDITLEDVFIKVANEANSLPQHTLENNNNSYNDY